MILMNGNSDYGNYHAFCHNGRKFLHVDRFLCTYLQTNWLTNQFQNDAVPLIHHLEFSPSVEGVMTFLFGRVMLCRDLEVAAQVARELGCSCVTLDGDRVRIR